jgi:ribokinase
MTVHQAEPQVAPGRAPSITVVGSTMTDMVAYVDRMPEDGETLHGTSFSMGFGGKGANQAVMAARLGADVAMVNCLGTDMFGDRILQNFAREGIDTSAVTRVTTDSSGVAPIWVDREGTNRIIVVPGANARMTEDDAARAVADREHLDVVIGQFEIPPEVTLSAFRRARDRQAITVLNPAPVAEISDELLAVTDYLIPNEVEFAFLAGDLGPEPDYSDQTLLAMAARWGARLVVTLGADGAAVAVPGGSVTRVRAPRVEAVDTTGAGDAFVGAFSYGLAAGYGPERAARLGCACASASVTAPGTQSSYPSRKTAAQLRDGI